jgi:exodeoxyribonuclease VII large subunit
MASRLDLAKSRLERQDQLLHTLGYTQVLSRGFALVRDADGRPLHRAADVATGATLDIEFADGHRTAIADSTPQTVPPPGTQTITEAKPQRSAPKSRPDKAEKTSNQGSLF